MSSDKTNILGYECRVVTHCPTPADETDDIHVVKEVIHYKDGRTVPNVRLIRNFQRPFAITKPGARDHKCKKEWEKKENVIEYSSTQTDLVYAVSKRIGYHGKPRGGIRELNDSPYVYGTDLLSTTALKKKYMQQYPDLVGAYQMAVFDTETDVLNGTNTITIATLSFKSKVVTAVRKDFMNGIADPVGRIKKAMDKYLGETIAARKIDWELVMVDSEYEILEVIFARAHEWKPDFIAAWNMVFDVEKIIEACGRVGVHPKDLLSDPKVPKKYRFFEWVVGPTQKVTAAGKKTPIKVADRWNTVKVPASFYFVDPMCIYRKLRIAKGERGSYSLDSVLEDELGIRKLKFKEADHIPSNTVDWHIFLQRNYKVEYVIYNVFDCISVELLDEKTLDVQIAFPQQCGHSDFELFRSQPKRGIDNLHYFVEQFGYIMGSTGSNMVEEFDSMTVSPVGWISTLPAYLVADNGLQVIEECPWMHTNVRAFVGDLDVSASLNISDF